MGEEMTRGCVLTFLYGRLHRERRKTERERERERKGKCFTSPAHHREKKFCVRKKKKIKFLFLLLKYATIKFLITHKFCSFCSSCVLRETSIGVDYTERRKTEREKRKNVCFPSPAAHHREREEIFFFREIKN